MKPERVSNVRREMRPLIAILARAAYEAWRSQNEKPDRVPESDPTQPRVNEERESA